jgi:hypothetical protein
MAMDARVTLFTNREVSGYLAPQPLQEKVFFLMVTITLGHISPHGPVFDFGLFYSFITLFLMSLLVSFAEFCKFSPI